MVIHNAQVSSDRIADIYNEILDALIMADANRPDAVAALLCAVGVQVAGRQLSSDEVIKFSYDASQWVSGWFAGQDERMN